MLVASALVLALQVSVRVGAGSRLQGDSARQARRDSIAAVIQERQRRRDERPVRRIPVTPELERTAFLDPGAKALLLKARAARLRQDSSLQSYDATTYQRVSVGLGIHAIGRQRLLFRTENATRVRWSRTGGAWVDVTGKRTVFPSLSGVSDDNDNDVDLGDVSPLPYFPGRESLWIGSGMAKAEVNENELVHPIALGSEAYYQYSTGDSLTIRLPDGTTIRLQELRVQPRRPEWKLSVGSFWFDVSTGQLVRAAYRLAVPIDIWAVAGEEARRERDEALAQGRKPSGDDDAPAWVKGLMSPLAANLEAVTIEFGLYGSHFWLPRTQYAEGWARAGFLRIPFRMEESFKYGDVNGTESIPAVPPPPKSLRDSLFPGDTGSWGNLPLDVRRERARQLADAATARAAARRKAREEECATSGSYTTYQTRYNSVRVAVRTPCDSVALAHSPDLPASAYDQGEEIFGAADRDELLKSLDFSLQAAWAPQRPVWRFGLPLTRYNRVEGFSTGIGGTMQLGRGYATDGELRLGTGDRWLNAQLGISRSNGRTTWRLGGYRRLAAEDDWGSPLGFGSGLSALLFGRDDGFYYRTTGAELERTSTREGGFALRFFGEHQATADVTTRFNVARAMGTPSEFGPNFAAVDGNAYGVRLRDTRSAGLNPQGWRAFSDVRLEGGWFDATGADSSTGHAFSRAAADFTITRGLGERAAAALTLGGGVSDHAPPQRWFFIGGTPSVRGERPGSAIGEAYWLGHFELGHGSAGMRRIVFGDIGWAGPRGEWRHPGRPVSGVGVGLSWLDGLFRVDLARGLYPQKRFRFDLSVDARF